MPKALGQLKPAIAALALLSCGCTLDWEKPDASVASPEAFRAATPRAAAPIPSAEDWAAKFGSPELSNIVEQALEQNLDIGAAVARIDQADAQARVSSAALWPTLTMNDFYQRTKQSGASLGLARPFRAVRRTVDSLGLNASYEIDFWGKNYDASQAARLLADSSRFDRQVVEIATVASAVNSYFQVLTAQDRLRIARQNIKIAETVLQAIKARVEVGVATALDFSQQETVVNVQRAALPPLEQTLRQTKNTLAVLLGLTPESADIKGGTLTRLRFPRISPGLPSELLLRRPDIAEAEAKLVSQEFSVLQARAAFFPSITLTDFYGAQSMLLKNLLRPEAVAWQVMANLAQPLFDGYNLQGQYMLQQGKYAELAQAYRKQVLTALSDVENALIAINETARQLKLQSDAVAAARRAFIAAGVRLREGVIDIVTLATTETTLFQNQDVLEQVRLAHFQAATSLFQALGGGWSEEARAIAIAGENAAYEADKGPWP
ncbi:MAG: efflux transporter outer membrane subunit [Methylocystis sp.]|nr:efflux transporter outer membrane subunit [Methylocystis sp.]